MKQLSSWRRLLLSLLLLLITGNEHYISPQPCLGFLLPVHMLPPPPQQQAATASSSSSFSSSVTREIPRNSEQDDLEEEYARCLSPRQERKEVDAEFEPSSWGRRLWKRVGRRLGARSTKPGTLILLRCGQSTMNSNQTFTGWLDPPLTELGVQQCRQAAHLLVKEGLDNVDVVYTSRLQRCISSAWHVLETMNCLYVPLQKTFRLNQRHFGALQGLSQRTVMDEFGSEVVQAWRRSLKARPPPLSKTDPTHPQWDRRYADFPHPEQLPSTESLFQCHERARSLWEHKIRRDLKHGKNVLVVGHRESIRGLSKVIDQISDQDIVELAVPVGVPMVYKFRTNSTRGTSTSSAPFLLPMEPPPGSLSQVHTHSFFLEKPKSIPEGDRVTSKTQIPKTKKRSTSLEESLYKLRQVEEELEQNIHTFEDELEQNLHELDLQQVGAELAFSMLDGENAVQFRTDVQSQEVTQERWADDECEFEEYEYDEFDDGFESNCYNEFVMNVVPLEEEQGSEKKQKEMQAATKILPPMNGPFVVFIRHGRTPHNNMQLFTGWEDPSLATEGVEDAKRAGQLLKRHHFEFDVVYTSWLTRAIQTAYYALMELDQVWLPMVKSWRLNERMYGALTGKSKKMIANEYGEEQLKRWRRGYTIRPPPVSSYSPSYPGNDERRAKHFRDIRISIRESINRSLERRRWTLHRKFPKTESLKDCMDRSIPFYTQKIQKEAIDKGKRVLITSHENAIRGILMHLCDIPEDAMNQLHLPNGLPLVYNVKGRCITLLDDGSGQDPMTQHDFGPAAKYLFKTCEIDWDDMLKPED